MLRLSQAAEWIDARLQGDDAPVRGAAIDTRQLQAGELFVALPGSRVDGHAFLRKAASLGAAGALVSQPQDSDFPQLVVPDVLAALQALGQAWRQAWGGRVIGVTGSNGKTTVKTMLAAILDQSSPCFATRGNLNNHIGVPLSLLNIRPEHARAVIEMGANHAGEIKALAGWAMPDVGVVTQAAAAHLEGFGSLDGVARAKGEMFSALSDDGTAIINADDQYAPLWAELAGSRPVLRFGMADTADVRAESVRVSADGLDFVLHLTGEQASVRLNLLGRHNVSNALAAAAGGLAMGASLTEIVAGLESMQSVEGRLRVQVLAGGLRLIDDSYNANPGSFAAAIAVLQAQPGPRHLVLGNMAELGAEAQRLHAEIGAQARAAGIDGLWACGDLAAAAADAFGAAGHACADLAALADALRPVLQGGGSVLIKGSRSAGMDRLVASLKGAR